MFLIQYLSPALHVLKSLVILTTLFWQRASPQCENSLILKMAEMLQVVYEFNSTLHRLEQMIQEQVITQKLPTRVMNISIHLKQVSKTLQWEVVSPIGQQASFVLQDVNSDCQDRRKSARNEFFKAWLVCIPFQLTITGLPRNSIDKIQYAMQNKGGHKNSFPSLYSICSILAESLS